MRDWNEPGPLEDLHRADELLARVERLIASRSTEADPLAWHVQALHLGDVKTIAMTAIRSAQQPSAYR